MSLGSEWWVEVGLWVGCYAWLRSQVLFVTAQDSQFLELGCKTPFFLLLAVRSCLTVLGINATMRTTVIYIGHHGASIFWPL